MKTLRSILQKYYGEFLKMQMKPFYNSFRIYKNEKQISTENALQKSAVTKKLRALSGMTEK